MSLILNVTLSGSLDDIALDAAALSSLLNPDDDVKGTGDIPASNVVQLPTAAATAGLVPAATVPAAVVAVADLDSSGLPWDERINAKNKGKNSDGTWRAKRNINKSSPGLFEQVQAELRAAMGSAPAAPVAGVPFSPGVGAVPGTENLQDTIALATQIVTHSTSPDTWGRINGIMIANELPQGVQSLTQFPAKIPAVHMALQQLAKELGVG